jgi:hypothetical protein
MLSHVLLRFWVNLKIKALNQIFRAPGHMKTSAITAMYVIGDPIDKRAISLDSNTLGSINCRVGLDISRTKTDVTF